jgi:hypothetical protein
MNGSWIVVKGKGSFIFFDFPGICFYASKKASTLSEECLIYIAHWLQKSG